MAHSMVPALGFGNRVRVREMSRRAVCAALLPQSGYGEDGRTSMERTASRALIATTVTLLPTPAPVKCKACAVSHVT